jgi:hypothetical protein
VPELARSEGMEEKRCLDWSRSDGTLAKSVKARTGEIGVPIHPMVRQGWDFAGTAKQVLFRFSLSDPMGGRSKLSSPKTAGSSPVNWVADLQVVRLGSVQLEKPDVEGKTMLPPSI